MKNIFTLIFALFLFSGVMTAGVVNDVGDGISEKENIASMDVVSVDFVIVINTEVFDEAVSVQDVDLKQNIYIYQTGRISGVVETYKSLNMAEDYKPDINSTTINYKATNPDNLIYLHRMTHSLSC